MAPSFHRVHDRSSGLSPAGWRGDVMGDIRPLDPEQDTGEFDVRALTAGFPAQEPGPAPVHLEVGVGAHTHPGLVRDNNEDHFIVARLARTMDVVATNLPEGQVPGHHSEAAWVLAVADGMGGAAAGEVASSLALTLGTELTIGDAKWPLRLDADEVARLERRVHSYFARIDEAVTSRAQATPGLRGMGTTLTVAYTVGHELIAFHVGDSRAYLFHDGQLRQLTRDQTVAQALVDAGQIEPREAESHHLRHVLTQAIGSGESPAEATTHRVQLAPGDRVVLCTDGLTDMANDEAIAGVLAQGLPAQATSEALVQLALDGGGKDNVTVVVADLS
jgi:protein phosphatase